MTTRHAAFAAGVAGIALLVSAFPASAHAILASSSPRANATVLSSPSVVSLDFTEIPDPALSQIHVLDASLKQVERSEPRAVDGRPRSLEVIVDPLPKGIYTVTWRVVSRTDGHLTGGAFAFGVGVPVTKGAVRSIPAAPPPSALSVVARWLFYAGIMLLVGATWVGMIAYARAPPRMRAVAWAGLVAAATGVVLIGVSQASADSVSLGTLLGTPTGRGLILRAAPLALSLAGVVVWKRLGSAIAGAGAALSILAHVAYGHAGTGRLAWGKIALQWTHFGAAAVWIGGLVALVAGLSAAQPDERARAVRRFSSVALFAVAVLAATGIARAADEYGSLRQVYSSAFGQMLLVKSGLLAALATLGAVNRWRNVPAVERSHRGLLAVSRAEIVLAAIVLAATGILTGVEPGQSIVASHRPSANGIVANATDFGTTVRVRLVADPGTPGVNRFTMTVTDYDTGKPITAPNIPLTFTFQGRPGISSSTLTLARQRDGSFAATGPNLAFLGPWHVDAFIARGAGSVQIPLALATRIDETTTVVPGTPTIYSVQLTGNASVQFYAEPGTAGLNEVHATFLRNGKQYEGLSNVSLVGTPAGGDTVALGARVFSPGHFIGDGTLHAGRWRFDVSVDSPDGPIAAYFETTIT